MMTTLQQPDHSSAYSHVPAPASSGGLLANTSTMTRRNLLRIRRTPNAVPIALAAPLVFVVLFNLVFGGSIGTGELEYIDYLIPGVLVLTAVFDSTTTAASIAQDLDGGSLDRFRALPIRRLAVLTGRTAADLLRLTVTLLAVVAIGLGLGFRPTEGPIRLAAAVLLTIALGHAFQWAYVWLGLVLKDPVAVDAVGLLPVLPLVFVASTFAPVQNMPDWIQPVAEHQPITVTVDAVRALIHGGELASPLVQSAVWTLFLIATWSALATRAFGRLS